MKVIVMAVVTTVLELILEASIALAGSAAVDTWYIRPQSECAVNGNGLAYTCASTPGGSGAFNSPMPTEVNWTPVTGVDQGDIVYVCGTHTQSLLIGLTATGTAEKHITIRFDCPGNPGKILKQTVLTEALQTGNWVNESTGVWYIALPSYANSPKRVWVNHVELMRSETKNVLGQPVSVNGPVRGWWFDDANKRLYLPSISNPAVSITEMRTLSSGNSNCAYSAVCFTKTVNQYFDLINPNLEGGGLGALYIIGASNLRIFGLQTVNDCRIGRLSNRGVYLADSAGNGTGTASHDIEIFNCLLDPGIPESVDGYTHEFNGVSHDGLFLSNGTNNNKFYNLKIRNWQHTGIGIAAISGTTTINGNIFENIEFECDWFIEYCRAFGVDGTITGAANGNIFRKNIINGMTVRSQLNGTNNIVEDNLFMNQRIGDVVIDKINHSQVLELQAYAGAAHNNVIRRNIFYNNPVSPCISFREGGASTVDGTIIEDNAFINCGGLDTPGHEYTVISIRNHASILNQIIRNNRFFVSNGQPTIFYKASGIVSLAGFEAACVGDMCTGNREYNTAGLVADESSGYADRCGFGMWWQATNNSLRKYVCFH